MARLSSHGHLGRARRSHSFVLGFAMARLRTHRGFAERDTGTMLECRIACSWGGGGGMCTGRERSASDTLATCALDAQRSGLVCATCAPPIRAVLLESVPRAFPEVAGGSLVVFPLAKRMSTMLSAMREAPSALGGWPFRHWRPAFFKPPLHDSTDHVCNITAGKPEPSYRGRPVRWSSTHSSYVAALCYAMGSATRAQWIALASRDGLLMSALSSKADSLCHCC